MKAKRQQKIQTVKKKNNQKEHERKLKRRAEKKPSRPMEDKRLRRTITSLVKINMGITDWSMQDLRMGIGTPHSRISKAGNC